ncbi:hypothetical protein SNEBB_006641 [Seison nebaliae]|nr:hypothetical protein SNEBB_006641 [Seison nebaliae]
MDGFSCQYLERKDLIPNILKFFSKSLKAKCMKPSFATKTFPNFWSMSTGTYEETHGILANRFVDLKKNAVVNVKTTNETKHYFSQTPMWELAVQNNKKVGSMNWPVSFVPRKAQTPDANAPQIMQFSYMGHLDRERQVYHVARWFNDLDVDLGLLYMNEPDRTGHQYGAHHPQMNITLKKMDKLFKTIVSLLRNHENSKDVNIVLLSDHGMQDLKAENHIHIDNYVSLNDISFYDDVSMGVMLHIHPKEGKMDKVWNDLQKLKKYAKIFKKDSIPEHYHYKDNKNAPPILVNMKQGYSMGRKTVAQEDFGGHGYSNEMDTMQAIFMADGPAFQTGSVDKFENVNIFGIILKLLGVTPSPNNGTEKIWKKVLTKDAYENNDAIQTPLSL